MLDDYKYSGFLEFSFKSLIDIWLGGILAKVGGGAKHSKISMKDLKIRSLKLLKI
ncbi:hypothetical protein SAMN05421761_102368 [Belliella pelovolcani]|uniref:Uncharacterized protein n=1 Tax=Belliella pelovolcani TaxID=529505 RepID=A0A1N7KV80_9BACT|nr:hypothetical protein SAMN05421761_102368 [Belliella pelovolcani]